MRYPIILCEDNPQQLDKLTETIQNYILFHENHYKLEYSSNNPYDIKNYVKKNNIQKGIYFLDINLSSDINGIDLAQLIRNNDVMAKIIFITTHNEMAPLTLKRQVEALGFIIKDDYEKMRDEIFQNLKLAYQRMEQTVLEAKNEKTIAFKIGSETLNFEVKDIIFIESSDRAHRVKLITKNGEFEFFNNLNKLEEQTQFLRVSRSLLINPQNIQRVDYKLRIIYFTNNYQRSFSLSKVKILKKALQDKNESK